MFWYYNQIMEFPPSEHIQNLYFEILLPSFKKRKKKETTKKPTPWHLLRYICQLLVMEL